MPDHAGRIARLREALPAAGVGALIVGAPTNLRYLTGYAGSNGLLVVGPDDAWFLTDSRYAEAVEPLRAFLQVDAAQRYLLPAVAPRLLELGGGAGRIGFEADWLTVSQHDALLADAPAGVALVPTTGLVSGLRVVKEPGEIAAIRAACAPLEAIYAELAAGGLVGATEADRAWLVETRLREAGMAGTSFPPIVAGGPHGALPHAEPRGVAIAAGTLVVVDIGARDGDGYCSDCTRTLATGPLPDGARDDYALVARAQQAGLDAIRPGAVAGAIDAAARAVIADAGAGELFGHSLGHGVGMDIHEGPILRADNDEVLRAGMVVSVEPGVYRPGRWGVRIEDLVVVTDDGCEILTGFTKALVGI